MTKKQKLIFGENGVEYRGGLKKGKPHGKGTIYFFEGKKSNKPTATTFDLAFFKVVTTGALESNITSKSKSSKKNNVLTTKYEGQFKNGNWHGEFACTNYLPRNKERHFIIKINNNKILSDMEKIKYPNGDVYIGEFKGVKFHGKGTLTRKDGSKYEGTWKKGVPHGKGKRKYINGDLYEGEWRNFKRHGRGTFKSHYGLKYLYVGEWKNNNHHGKGTVTFVDGEKYIGQWKNNSKHGKGANTWPNGDKYVGGWKNDQMHGKGTHTWAIGVKYVGDWKDGKKNGKGANTWPNGDKYVGGWKNDQMHGKGTHTWNGDKYVGGWKNNAKHGKGTYTFSNGIKEEGIWREDELIKVKKLT